MVDERYGSDGLRMGSLTDRAGVLRRGERQLVRDAMDRISKRFPQLFVAIYTDSMGELTYLRQYGFWLLNRSCFEDVPADKPNEAGILLTIDPETRAAGMIFGYLLEPFLSESDTFECLSRAHGHWLDGRYADGIVRVLSHLETVLMKRSRQARRDPEGFQRKVLPASLLGDPVKRLREGHQPAESDREEVSK